MTAPLHDDIAFRSAKQLLADLEVRHVSSVELVSALTERMSILDRPSDEVGLCAVIDLLPDAMAVAAECDRQREVGAARGPLHGLPVIVKDNIEVRGGRATAGSLALAGSAFEVDAPLVARLREAGAIVLATANLSEWANIRSGNSSSGWSAIGGLCANPWDRTRSAGGSSSGSGVAVAAGFAPFAVGTETDGSITCPASLNGVVGIKPTVGSVPTSGVVPISSSQDVPGPLARSLDDASMMLAVIAGDPDLTRRIHAIDVRSLRIGFIDRWCTGDDRADQLAADALGSAAGAFAGFTRADVPETTEDVQKDEFTVLLGELSSELDEYLATRPGCAVRSLADVIEFNRQHSDSELLYFGQEFFEQSIVSGGKSSPEYREARRRNVEWADGLFSSLWESFDVVVAPAYAPAWITDFAKGHAEARGGAVTTPAAIAGLPIVTIPCGLVDGLPVGVSFVGPAHSEARLIAAAGVIEARLGLAGDRSFRPPAFRVGS